MIDYFQSPEKTMATSPPDAPVRAKLKATNAAGPSDAIQPVGEIPAESFHLHRAAFACFGSAIPIVT